MRRPPASHLDAAPSPAILDALRLFEGFSSRAYVDAAGVLTIGYGHALPAGASYPNGISEAHAERLLRGDALTAARAVADLVTVPLTGNEFDALLSFTFNLGRSRLASSTLLRKLNASDYTGAAAEFERWVYADGRKLGGLVERRRWERAHFLTAPASVPDPDPDAAPERHPAVLALPVVVVAFLALLLLLS